MFPQEVSEERAGLDTASLPTMVFGENPAPELGAGGPRAGGGGLNATATHSLQAAAAICWPSLPGLTSIVTSVWSPPPGHLYLIPSAWPAPQGQLCLDS